ncbi:hypothetical protein HPB51_029371 [Rhipicephalus microplus]|uniref:Uncharacterized protein n=1 Tax=Rhipicephalus microplus TaxID=6941 RepID=A0A9J6CUD3_RHIMP|nr:hypothetical protein HPB51_029371 [Rhipicephalus microplus]
MAEQKVSESYQTVKCALIKLHERYEASKAERNIVHRYALFKQSFPASVATTFIALTVFLHQRRQQSNKVCASVYCGEREETEGNSDYGSTRARPSECAPSAGQRARQLPRKLDAPLAIATASRIPELLRVPPQAAEFASELCLIEETHS